MAARSDLASGTCSIHPLSPRTGGLCRRVGAARFAGRVGAVWECTFRRAQQLAQCEKEDFLRHNDWHCARTFCRTVENRFNIYLRSENVWYVSDTIRPGNMLYLSDIIRIRRTVENRFNIYLRHENVWYVSDTVRQRIFVPVSDQEICCICRI